MSQGIREFESHTFRQASSNSKACSCTAAPYPQTRPQLLVGLFRVVLGWFWAAPVTY